MGQYARRVKNYHAASSAAVDVLVEVPWHGIRACQLPMGIRGAIFVARVAFVRPLLLCTKLADLSHEQCAGQTRRESPARSAAGAWFNAVITYCASSVIEEQR